MKCLKSDRAREFMSTDFIRFYNEIGIQRKLTIRYTPEQNGVVERKKKLLWKWQMLHWKNLPY